MGPVFGEERVQEILRKWWDSGETLHVVPQADVELVEHLAE